MDKNKPLNCAAPSARPYTPPVFRNNPGLRNNMPTPPKPVPASEQKYTVEYSKGGHTSFNCGLTEKEKKTFVSKCHKQGFKTKIIKD